MLVRCVVRSAARCGARCRSLPPFASSLSSRRWAAHISSSRFFSSQAVAGTSSTKPYNRPPEELVRGAEEMLRAVDLSRPPTSALADSLQEVMATLTELAPSLKPSLVVVACKVAHHARMDDQCCEIFLRHWFRAEHNTAPAQPEEDGNNCPAHMRAHLATMMDRDRPVADVVPESILRSACRLRDIFMFERCATLIRHLHHNHGEAVAEMHEAWMGGVAAVAALRVFWYAALCASQLNEARINTHAEEKISVDDQPRRAKLLELCRELAPLLHMSEDQCHNFFHAAVRFARYHSHTHAPTSSVPQDDWAPAGQAAFVAHVFQHWMQQQQQQSKDENAAPLPWLTAYTLAHVLRTCVQARQPQAASAVALYAELHLLSVPVEVGLRFHDDALMEQSLHYFHKTRHGVRAVRWMARLRSRHPTYVPSISLCCVLARIAGAQREAGLAAWCLEHLLHPRQPNPPSSAEMFACACAYARCAAPSFHHVVRSLMTNELVRLQDEQLVYLSLLHCRRNRHGQPQLEQLLKHTRWWLGQPDATCASEMGVADGEALVAHFVGPMGEAVWLPSRRNVEMLLLNLQEMEHPSFMAYYRCVLGHLPETLAVADRARWAIYALGWVHARWDGAAADDVMFVATEALHVLWASSGTHTRNPTVELSPSIRHSLRVKWGDVKHQYDTAWWAAQHATWVQPRSSMKMEWWSAFLTDFTAGRTQQPSSVGRFLKKSRALRTRMPAMAMMEDTTKAMWCGSAPSTALQARAAEREAWLACIK